MTTSAYGKKSGDVSHEGRRSDRHRGQPPGERFATVPDAERWENPLGKLVLTYHALRRLDAEWSRMESQWWSLAEYERRPDANRALCAMRRQLLMNQKEQLRAGYRAQREAAWELLGIDSPAALWRSHAS